MPMGWWSMRYVTTLAKLKMLTAIPLSKGSKKFPFTARQTPGIPSFLKVPSSEKLTAEMEANKVS